MRKLLVWQHFARRGGSLCKLVHPVVFMIRSDTRGFMLAKTLLLLCRVTGGAAGHTDHPAVRGDKRRDTRTQGQISQQVQGVGLVVVPLQIETEIGDPAWVNLIFLIICSVALGRNFTWEDKRLIPLCVRKKSQRINEDRPTLP